MWYVAAHANELSEALLARRICDEPVVLYRTSAGEAVALHDRCPHRFVPLSMGKRDGDAIRCGYHGLAFDSTGACVDAPNDEEAQRRRACVRSYPVVERHTLVWMWMGEAELADPALIPDFSFLADTVKFGISRGYSYIRGNYQLIADNLLDLSHVHYLHPGVHEGSDFADFTNKVQRDGDTVWSMLWRHHYHIDDARRATYGFASSGVEGQGHARWDAPGVLIVHTAYWDHGKSIDEGAVELPSAHLLTPETATTSHYFWASGRTFDIHNPAITAGTERLMRTVFETEDGPMVEAQQRAMGDTTDFLEHQPIILRADAAGVMARRLMKQKIRAEAVGGVEAMLAAG